MIERRLDSQIEIRLHEIRVKTATLDIMPDLQMLVESLLWQCTTVVPVSVEKVTTYTRSLLR